jgi:hypothetical protein
VRGKDGSVDASVSGAIQIWRSRDVMVLAELIKGWWRRHLWQARERESTTRVPHQNLKDSAGEKRERK